MLVAMSGVSSHSVISVPADRRETSGRGFRALCETLLSLLISVLMVRTFLVEGYLISTGSMAPHFFGSHKRVECPHCGKEFAVGTEFERSGDDEILEWAVCPNCLYDEIPLQDRPVERGDHLLVWKNAYDFRPPRRWEVVVFRNPNSPLETFIKRVAGLPGERIEIRGGNLLCDGRLARKSMAEQRAMLLPVYEESYFPAEDEQWIPRWTHAGDDSGWTRGVDMMSWRCDGSETSGRLVYRHSLRTGGDHVTTVGLTEPLTPAQQQAFQPREELSPLAPEPPFPGVRYGEATNSLTCRGVLPDRVFHQLLAVDQTPSFSRGIHRLREASRHARIKDFEAYNAHSPHVSGNEISEFFLSFRGRFHSGAGGFSIALAIPEGQMVCRLDAGQRSVRLWENSSAQELRTGKFESGGDGQEFLVEFSTIDRQICLAINGTEVFESWNLAESPPDSDFPLEIAMISDVRGDLEIRDLKLSRDIFYTMRHGRHAVGEEFTLGADEYFVLGDNSSVSSDSRQWDRAAVPGKLLVGKPFAVHLPSRTTTIGGAESSWRIRLPDFSRIRFVR
jgi:signal peptidase I